MIYVTSDIHGQFQDLLTLLKKADFNEEDFLFIIGDVIDRTGRGGVDILLWLLDQPNVELILGNHEAMMLSCSFVFDTITEKSIDLLNNEHLALLSDWMFNGAENTLNELKKCSREQIADILDYLRDAPLYEAVSTDAGDYLLVHGGLDGYKSGKKLSDFDPDILLWSRPELNDRYIDGVTVILGHTPVYTYGEKYAGKALKTESWVNIDTGAGHGGKPMLLRLDDGKEYYL